MPGRHHIETPPGESRATPLGTLVIVGIAVLAVIAGVATIAAWVASTAEEDTDLSTIVVQPSASLPYPTATPDTLLLDELASATPGSALPTLSVPPSGPVLPSASAALLVDSVPRPASTNPAPAPPGTTSTTVSTLASPAPTAAPSRPQDLTASYAVTSTSADGFVAGVTVRNPTAAAQSWNVTLTYSAGTKMTVTGYWNAVPTANGRHLGFDGDPLAAGASYSFGFQAETANPEDIRLVGCTINGIACDGF